MEGPIILLMILGYILLLIISVYRSTQRVILCCFNVRGFNSFVPYVRKLLDTHDFVAISEHWLHDNKLNRLAEISNKFLYCARASNFASADSYGTKRGQGGVALFWGKYMGRVAHMSNLVHDRFCGIRLETSNGSIFNIISIDLPAQGSPESYSSCLDDLGEVIETRDMGSYTIICGDANADISRKGKDGAVICVNKQGKTLLKFLDKYQLVPVKCILYAGNHVPTYEAQQEVQ